MSFIETLYAMLLASLVLPPLLASQLSDLNFFTSSQRVLGELLEEQKSSPRNLQIDGCQVTSSNSGIDLRRCLLITQNRESIEHFIIVEKK